ncbi:AAA family ATPase [Photorhabdus khanii]|uniref:ATP-dependent endonuclease n=4 Tax=Morganellaceae TaxID=1903414 RepID=A0A7X5QQK9_9GAMM|nr:AAA family ATPase [Photorhabdus khanii]NHB98679.1 ATP-dependent endonuclease [Photorhabdus stackebrandtii]
MSILIDTIRIAGFRGIKNLEVSLSRIIVLIGPNNAGKTSLIKALQLSLGDYSRYLSEEDFYISPDERRVNEIIVDVRIVPADANGDRVANFDIEWLTEFGDKIQSEANGNQFVAIRTRSEQNVTKGGFDTNRTTLEIWPPFETWTTIKVKGTKLGSRLQSLPLVSMEAQRDIHQDLRDRSSFIGKILASVEYDKNDILELESLIKQVNDDAVDKSKELKSLKSHLEKLNQSIGGTGGAEVTPFPKKIRDLSKNFSVYSGETDTNSFSMEYHGMGTRSWASMLTIKSFIEILSHRHIAESEPLFPILTVEEPEAHLHPNAQKTLYRQLSDTNGQLILSTHSPFLAAMADLYQIRSLVKTKNGIVAHKISHPMTDDEKKSISRSILAKNGELLFAKCMLLCEGVTEEQVLPAMFEIYASATPWSVGLSCVNVGGKDAYIHFALLPFSFGIPICIISDNDINPNSGTKTQDDVTQQIEKLSKKMCLSLTKDFYDIYFLDDGNDFEKELIDHGLRDEIIDAFVLLATTGNKNNEKFREAKYNEFNQLTDEQLLEKMSKEKASYAGFLADVLLANKRIKSVDDLVPPNVRASFDCIKGWLAC